LFAHSILLLFDSSNLFLDSNFRVPDQTGRFTDDAVEITGKEYLFSSQTKISEHKKTPVLLTIAQKKPPHLRRLFY